MMTSYLRERVRSASSVGRVQILQDSGHVLFMNKGFLVHSCTLAQALQLASLSRQFSVTSEIHFDPIGDIIHTLCMYRKTTPGAYMIEQLDDQWTLLLSVW